MAASARASAPRLGARASRPSPACPLSTLRPAAARPALALRAALASPSQKAGRGGAVASARVAPVPSGRRAVTCAAAAKGEISKCGRGVGCGDAAGARARGTGSEAECGTQPPLIILLLSFSMSHSRRGHGQQPARPGRPVCGLVRLQYLLQHVRYKIEGERA